MKTNTNTQRLEDFQRKLEREMKSGLVSLLVLSIIKDSKGPVYGYKIISDLSKTTDGVLVLKEGSVYPILHYLQTQRFVISFMDESPSGIPRRYYEITKLGRRALLKGLSSWTEFKNILDVFFEEREGWSDG